MNTGNFTRISGANLGVVLVNKDTSERTIFGVRAPGRQRPGEEKPIRALSFGSKITYRGRGCLEEKFSARAFVGSDNRFEVPSGRVEDVMTALADDYYDSDPMVDWDPKPELHDRLTGDEFWEGVPPILSSDEFETIKPEFITLKRQPPPKDVGTSDRGPAVRLFCFRQLVMPGDIVAKLLDSSPFVILSSEELGTTRGGTCMGQTKDGIPIADNLGMYF